jgi:hypothetical protein
MEKIYSTVRKEGSTPEAIICWPKGLDGERVVYPNGGSAELDEAIRVWFKNWISPVEVDEAK